MFTKKRTQIVTKGQLEIILTAWGVDVIFPTKKNNQFVCFPGGMEYVELSVCNKQKDSDYKGRLYNIEFYYRPYID
jgi:hypothetical protein